MLLDDGVQGFALRTERYVVTYGEPIDGMGGDGAERGFGGSGP